VRVLKAPQVATLLGTWRVAASAGRSAPLHQALAQRITALLLDGRIGVGARLPAERALSEALAVSRTTVAGAYALLRESGFCESRRGSGSYTALPGGVGAHSAGGWHSDAGVSGGAGPDDGADPAGLIDLMVAAPLVRLPELQTALRGAAEQLPRFVDTGGLAPYGLPALRQAVAEDYTARGLPTEPGQILVTNGAQGAITLISRLLLRPGDRMVVEAPSYPNALDSFRAAQARLVPVPVPTPEPEPAPGATSSETHADAPDNALEEALTQLRPRLVYSIPFFQNPTGRVMDPERQAALARAARRAGSWVLADETLIDTALDRPVPHPFGAAVRPADAEAVLACGSLAKSFWGGLRIGWVRGPARMVHELAAARAAADLASPVLDQLAAVEVLTGSRAGAGTGGTGRTLAEQTLARHRELWLEQRAALVEAVREAFPQWTFRVPEGGLCLWIRMDREEAGALTYRARTHGLLLHAGPRFGADPGTFERYIRLPYTQPVPVLGEAVRRLALAARVPGPRRPGEHRADLVA
jgi:DNA-binding transcriptional MocR family regulator